METHRGRIVGGTNIHSIDRKNGTFGTGTLIHRRYRGQGYAGEAKEILLRYAFHEMRLQKYNVARFPIADCVIDGLPETHATREFTQRHSGRVYMNFFNEHQRGTPRWDPETHMVQLNRTEALDPSRAAVRDGKLVLPHRSERVEEFARHLAADAKVLEEDEETGIQKYRYVRTGTNHFSMAFTYAWLAGMKAGFLHSRFEIYVPEEEIDEN